MIKKFFQKIVTEKKNHNRKVESEPVYKYCPECGDEYRVEFDTCAKCEVALIHENPKRDLNRASTLEEIKPTDKLVGVKQGTSQEIKQYKNLLARHGFASMIYADQAGMGKG